MRQHVAEPLDLGRLLLADRATASPTRPPHSGTSLPGRREGGPAPAPSQDRSRASASPSSSARRGRLARSQVMMVTVLLPFAVPHRSPLFNHGAPSHEQVDPDPRYVSPGVSEASQSQRYGSPDQRYGDADSEIRGRKVRDADLQARGTGAQSPRHGGADSEIRGLRVRYGGAESETRVSRPETQGRRLRVRGRRV
jgi:hypothetical protein